MAKKYYVVWEGLEKGIFKSWDKCKKSIQGVKNAKYKSFDSLEVAEKAFKGSYEDYKGKKNNNNLLSEQELLKVGMPNMNSIAVDAACSGNPGVMYYRAVDLNTKKILFQQRPVYSDSKIAINWVKQRKYKTQLAKNESNQKSFELLERAQKWLQENDYTTSILKWQTQAWGEIPADYGNKK